MDQKFLIRSSKKTNYFLQQSNRRVKFKKSDQAEQPKNQKFSRQLQIYYIKKGRIWNDSNYKNRRQRVIKFNQEFSILILIPKKIQQMNKVSIINLNLHEKYIIQDQKDYLPQPSYKETYNRRKKSPEETIKRLIKKGLAKFISPFSRPKSGFKFDSDKQNTGFRNFQGPLTGNDITFADKFQSSSLLFTCSRGHGTSFNSKSRVHTEGKQNPHIDTRYVMHKTRKGESWDEVLPNKNHMFRDFRNISQQSLSRLKVEKEKRSFKLEEVHKVKYDSAWKKYPVPSKSKQKKKSQHRNRKIEGIA